MMKRHLIYLLTWAALAATLVTACRQEPQPQGPNSLDDMHKITLQAVFGDAPLAGTKVAIADTYGANFTWSAGDQIAVHSSDGAYHILPLLTGAGTVNATFEGELNGTQDFYAVYPASAKVDANYGNGTLQVTLPDSYTISGSMGAASPLPMIAVNSGSTLSFKHVGAIYRFTLDNVPAGTTQITVTFDKDVTGTFTVSSPSTSAPYIATTSGSTGRTVTFNLSSPLAAKTDGFVLNVPVPTGAYAGNIMVVATGGTTLQARIPNPRTIARATGRQISKAMSAPFGGPFTYNDTEYYISQGNMYKTADGYDLYPNWTGGLDQFGNKERRPKPDQAATDNGYFTWLHLVDLFDSRTGGDAPSESNIIDINNGKTPISGCKLPTKDQWAAFTTGTTRPGSSVNGSESNYHYALIRLTGYTNGNISNPVGLLLLPDNATLTEMTKTFTWNTPDISGNTDVTEAQLNEYLSKGAVFLPVAGCCGDGTWMHGDSYGYGYYWSASSNTLYIESCAHSLRFSRSSVGPTYSSYLSDNNYYPVRLLQE